MLGRILEVADDSRHLSLYRGFVVIQDKNHRNSELGRVPLDDILAVIAHAHGLSYTNNLLVELAVRGIPFVLCDDLHNSVGMLWPVEGHHQQARRIDAQIEAGVPKKKAVWAKIVRSKITQQAFLLEQNGKSAAALHRLARNVKSGDPENCEAQAARIYWTELFGREFVRDRLAGGINMLLNYGYTILRSATARAVIAAGLHPSIGVHHNNGGNPMRLVDDLMEPFRPVVDCAVVQIVQTIELGGGNSDEVQLTPEVKRHLVSCLFQDACYENSRTPVMVAIQNLATSLALLFLGERNAISLPQRFEPVQEEDDPEA